MKTNELYTTLANQTGLSPDVIRLVLDNYEDLIMNELLENFQVPFGKIGKFTLTLFRPRKVTSPVDSKVQYQKNWSVMMTFKLKHTQKLLFKKRFSEISNEILEAKYLENKTKKDN
ncbi:MAG: HU family DNA-binding protein [Erysipelotrichaceae bacterium]